jgi:hypothetical protein
MCLIKKEMAPRVGLQVERKYLVHKAISTKLN